MRVDLGNLAELTQKSSAVQNRETGAVLVEQIETKEVDGAGKTYRIKHATYEKPLPQEQNALEQAEQMQNMDPFVMKNQMEVLSNTTTEEDYAKMEEDGFHVNGEEIPVIVTQMDKIKIQLAKAGVDISFFGDDLSKAQIESELGSAKLPTATKQVGSELGDQQVSPTKEQIETELGNAHLPATKENVEETQEALAMAQSLEAPSQGTMKYMLDHGLEITVGNLYLAQHSASGHEMPEPTEPIPFEELDGQIQKVLEEAGFEANDENLEDGRWLVEHEVPLTGENLSRYQQLKSLVLPAKQEEVMSAIAYAIHQGGRPKDALLALTGRRRLEEARLEMSAKANYAHIDKDLAIDTASMVDTVDALKEAEDAYYKSFLSQGGVDPTQENVDTYQTIERVFEELKAVPAYVLDIAKGEPATPQALHDEGKALQDTFEKANESYEALMTAPRKDLGDSIQKAFRNVGAILEDLGLEASEMNMRAVRILAYNQIEITPESILEMKALDEKVQQAFRNMTPPVVREMVKTGVNPLDMTLEELNRAAVQIQDEIGENHEEVRFSKYLYQLEQNSEISEEERSAYIGIYRLIARIEQGDGAAIGMLARQGMPFTMRNLLSMARSSKRQGMEYAVDEEFGSLEELKAKGTSVTEQIEAGFQRDCLKDVVRQLEPKKLMEIPNWQDLTPEQLKQAMEAVPADEEAQRNYLRQELGDYRASAASPEEVYQMLDQYDIPKTVSTVLAAQEMMNDRNGVFRKLFQKAKNTENATLADVKQQVLERFAEAVKTPEEMAEAYKKLADTAENVMKTMLQESEPTSLDIKEMRMARTQIELGARMAKEENYYIPVLVGDSVTGVSLKIVRGTEKKGRVDILFGGDSLGEVAAQFSVKGEKVEGYLVSDSESTLDALRKQEDDLAKMLSADGAMEVELRYVQAEGDLTNIFPSKAHDASGQRSEAQTRTLYHMAESFLKTLQSLDVPSQN